MNKTHGFTLIELVMVMVVTGIMAASIAIFFKPAIDSYFDTRRRAELVDIADTALRRIARDLRRAAPNSIRTYGSTCLELVPTVAGGLYRMSSDPAVAASDPLDTTTTDASFDVFTTLDTAPTSNDFVVIGNQNTGDLYATPTSPTRGTISSWTTPPNPGGATVGVGRIALSSATQFPAGYAGGRFSIVSQNEQRVFYLCNGTQLQRATKTFAAGGGCPTSGTPLATRLATDATACVFSASESLGYVWMRIELLDQGERVALSYGVHVENVP